MRDVLSLHYLELLSNLRNNGKFPFMQFQCTSIFVNLSTGLPNIPLDVFEALLELIWDVGADLFDRCFRLDLANLDEPLLFRFHVFETLPR